MIRVQCAFMDTPETEAIVEYIAQQESTGSAYELPEYIPEGGEWRQGLQPQREGQPLRRGRPHGRTDTGGLDVEYPA